jgi:hypothetical protein
VETVSDRPACERGRAAVWEARTLPGDGENPPPPGGGEVKAMLCGSCPAAFSEMFPTRVRTTAVGVSYSIALALFGGTTPFDSTWLIDLTGSVLAPAAFIVATALVSVVAALRVRETVRSALPA